MSQGGHHGIAHWAGLRCVPLIDSTITWSGQQRAQDAQVLEDHSCLSAAFAAHRRRCSATCTQQAIGLVVSRVSHRCGPRCHWYRLQSARSSNQPGEAPERSAGPPSRDRRQVRYSRSFLCPKGLKHRYLFYTSENPSVLNTLSIETAQTLLMACAHTEITAPQWICDEFGEMRNGPERHV